MKKTLSLLGLLSIAALASCNIENELQKEEPEIHFFAVMEQPVHVFPTKAYSDETFHLKWNKNDLVSIFYGTTLNRQFRFTGESGDPAGGFTRSDEDPPFYSDPEIETTPKYNFGILPWHQQNGCDQIGTLKVIFPANQDHYDKGIGARPLMVARTTDNNLLFKHVGAYLGVTLKGEGVSVASITFQTNDSELIAGRVVIKFDSDGLPVFDSFVEEYEHNSSTITMVLQEPVVLSMEEEKVFYLNVPAKKFNGYILTVTDPAGRTFTKERNSEFTLERGGFTPLPATVTFSPATVDVTGVTVSPKSLEMTEGEEITLTATVAPDNATNKNVTWTSSDSNVATVDDEGNVTAIGVGTATITVTTEEGDKTATCAVTVKAHVTSVSLDKTELEMFVGDDPVALIATVNPANAANKNVTWTSSDSNVATVNADGEVSAVGKGTATITVTTVDGGKTASCVVTVENVVTYDIVIDPAENANVDAGSTFTFKLMLTTITNNKPGEPVDVAADASWTSSDTAIATIAAGVAKGVKEGTVTITAKYTTPDGVEKTQTAPLKVNKNPNQAGDDVPIGGGSF